MGLATLVIACMLQRAYLDWLTNRRTEKLAALDAELVDLCKEIAHNSKLRLSSEHIPQKFPSKEDAEEFGKKWSLGGEAAYRATAVDDKNCDESHPKFDRASISGGILYTYPALFFGLNDVHRDDDDWILDFMQAKNSWLKNYLSDLKLSSGG